MPFHIVGQTRRNTLLKLVGVREFYNITRAKIISAVNCCVVVSLCATATFVVDTAIDRNTVQAQPLETEVTITVISYPEGYDPDTTSEESSETESAVTSSETSESSDVTESSASESTSDTSGSTTASETSKETTKETTKETSSKITEKELKIAVYATTTINVRKGPGTNYGIVKNVYKGDQIDVVAETSNGWYKTINGNYVKKSLTSETKPKADPTTKPKANSKATNTSKPKATSTSKPKATATTKPKATNTPKPTTGEAVRCKITFYGPQKLKDGTYSKATASGTTCVEGRTVAADWSIFPKGTKIYIANDPLGGDGYYTVEDKGSAVKGYIIDIYAEDGETGNHSTCYRNVSVVK